MIEVWSSALQLSGGDGEGALLFFQEIRRDDALGALRVKASGLGRTAGAIDGLKHLLSSASIQ